MIGTYHQANTVRAKGLIDTDGRERRFLEQGLSTCAGTQDRFPSSSSLLNIRKDTPSTRCVRNLQQQVQSASKMVKRFGRAMFSPGRSSRARAKCSKEKFKHVSQALQVVVQSQAHGWQVPDVGTPWPKQLPNFLLYYLNLFLFKT